MQEIIYSWINQTDWHRNLMIAGNLAFRFAIILSFSLIAGKIAGKIFIKTFERASRADLFPFNKSLLHKGAVRRFTFMFPFILLYFASGIVFADSAGFMSVLNRLLFITLIGLGIYTTGAFLDAVDHYYHNFEVSKKNPIKGYIQLIKILITILGIIIVIASLINRSPWGIISGFGAMTALVLLIFRDWIQGLIASIQINANNLVVIGDSIEIEKYGVNGEVIDISLSTVKVKNWDNTLSMVPSYSLITETFRNWHGVKESEGRRMRRILLMDIASIKLPDEKILKNISEIQLMKDTEELRRLRASVRKSRSSRLNAGEETNIGLFRKYVEIYLRNHRGINRENKIFTRLLEPTADGLPLQIYLYTTIIDSTEYEKLVAEVFEHLFMILPEFGLRLFQNPSGHPAK